MRFIGDFIEEPEIDEIEYYEMMMEEDLEPKKLPVSLKDGYAYVNIGVTIEMQYIAIALAGQYISIPGVGPDYGTILGRTL